MGGSAPSSVSRMRELTPSAPITMSASSTVPSVKRNCTTSPWSVTLSSFLLKNSVSGATASVSSLWKSPRCTVR
ncbi:hypothetical protein D3C86_1849000 [compost metagenome]